MSSLMGAHPNDCLTSWAPPDTCRAASAREMPNFCGVLRADARARRTGQGVRATEASAV